ncbi:glycoside hydrolase family 3 N-terminal domain-containing protein [Kitasatospora sp. NPDC002040]|uniref:glycoside hydrolase family 3 protein n=1 Tax=Kitasatospora sp. NPDC002040 TaxID=3154661 RepID=UPI0033223919
MKRHHLLAGALMTAVTVAAGTLSVAPSAAATAPYLDARRPVERRVDDLLARMTLPEKIGQMTQAERNAVDGDPARITDLKLGSLLSGGGSTPTPNTPAAWADMVDGYQARALATRLRIPLLYGVDSVHGHGNLVGATVFPHNIALGATRDPDLVREAAHITATETRATGPQWVFAPCVCVARDDRWGRTYESFGEDPDLVTRLETAIDGFQGRNASQLDRPDRVLASAKHFAGDGDTTYGSAAGSYKLDQGVTITSRERFRRIDLAPYVAAVREHRVGSIMPSYSSVDWTEDGVGNPVKMSAHHELLTEVLKQKIGFDGFLISDWDAINQLPGDYATQVRTAVNAGLDMFMVPYSADRFEQALLAEVASGQVSTARIDDAVRRVLRAKFQLGLFEHPFTDRRYAGTIGSAEHRAVAREAVAKSQVLLKNDHGALPLGRGQKIYVAGANADNPGNQAGGWTVTWQGASGDTIPATTLLEGIRQYAPDAAYSLDASAPTAGYDVGVVVVGETPYAEGVGDVGNNGRTLELSAADRANIDRVCAAIATCVVLDVAGRPQIVTDQLPKLDALVMSWLPGSEGAGVADVLFGERAFSGKLPVSWPRSEAQEPINIGDRDYDPLFRYGFGLTTRH